MNLYDLSVKELYEIIEKYKCSIDLDLWYQLRYVLIEIILRNENKKGECFYENI